MRVFGSHRALAVFLSGIGILLAGAHATTQPPGPEIQNLRLPSGIESTEYRVVLVGLNIAQPLWSITAGAFSASGGEYVGVAGTSCEGLTFDSATGVFSGTPIRVGACGPFVVQLDDASGGSATREFTIDVVSEIGIVSNATSFVSLLGVPSGAALGGFPVGRSVETVEFAPNGRYAYLTSTASMPDAPVGSVLVWDTLTHSVVRTIPVPFPVAVAPASNGQFVVVAGQTGPQGPQVTVFETASFTTVKTVPLTSNPTALAVSQDNQVAFVGTASNKLVLVQIPGPTPTTTTLDLAATPRAFAVDPHGQLIYVAGSSVFGLSGLGPIPLESDAGIPQAIDLSVSLDSRFAYVTASDSSLHVVDLLNQVETTRIPIGGTPTKLALSQDGQKVFITLADQSRVVVVSTISLGIIGSIQVNPGPADIALTPNGLLRVITRDLSSARVGVFYQSLLTAAGGRGPYRFSVTSGSLPPGIVMGDFGVLSGTPTVAGHYEFQVTAVDADVPPQSAIRLLTIDVTENLPPTAVLQANPNPALTGESVRFDGSLSSDPNADSGDQIAQYEWDFDDDGIFEAQGPVVFYAFQTNGTHHVTLRVTDSGGLQGSTSASIVTRTAPLAQFSHAPVEPWSGQLVSFDASSSQAFDVNNSIVRYEWDFDGTGFTVSGTTPLASHVFSQGGGHLVTLRVTDSFGLSGTSSAYINVRENLPPSVLVFASPKQVIAGGTVMFSADVFEPEGQQVTFRWDFQSDGVVDSTQQSPVFSYPSPGTYIASVTVTDEVGAHTTATVSVDVVANHAPSAAFTTQSQFPVARVPLLFEASGSYDPDEGSGGGIVRYSWTFGDGATGDGFSIEHAYNAPGTYTAQLTITDAGGLTSSTTQSIVVGANHAPLAVFTAPASPVVAGVPVTFDASPSSDPDTIAGDAIVRYEWDLDGNGTFEVDGPSIAARTFATTGSYQVTLRVTDRAGATGVQTQTLDVAFGLINQKLSNALVGASYQQQLAAGGATGPVVFSITNGPFTGSGPYDGELGTACEGLEFTDLGRLAGTPMHAGVCGPFAVTATDGVASAAHTYTLRVVPALAYVANNGSSTVSAIDPVTRTEVAAISVPGQPGGVAVRPDGERAYVTLSGDLRDLQSLHVTNPGHTVAVIDTTTQAVVATIPVGVVPTGIVASPDGQLMYVTNSLSQSISVIDTNANTVVGTIAISGVPVRLVVSPDGSRLYVADVFGHVRVFTAGGAQEAAIDLQNDQVSTVALSPDGRHLLVGALNRPAVRVFDTTTLMEVEGTVLAGGPVSAIGVTPDGRQAYLAANPVGVVDLNGFVLQASVPQIGMPFEAAFTADGGRALVTDFDSRVELIDTADQIDAGTIVVGQRPAGLGVVPNPSLHITTRVLPAGATGVPYDFAVVAAGGRPGYVFTINPVTLPPGLSADATGRVTGTPSQTGVYQLAVAVADADLPQQTVTALVLLTIGTNHPPVAQFTVTPDSAVVDEIIQFDGRESFDPDRAAADRIVAFAWDLDNDGVFNDGIGSTAERTFPAAGQYMIRLRVIDRGGLTHIAERLVSVNPFRLGDFSAQPNPVIAGVPVSFNALGKGENSFTRRYDWDFTSDGMFDVLDQPETQHAYGAAGTYQVTLRGTDDTGQSALIARPITVIANAPPVAAFTATPSTTLAGIPVLFDATSSSDPDPEAGGGVVRYAWTFGDGTTGDGFLIEHTYAAFGTFTVRLTVTDTSGTSATTTRSVFVTENHAPVAAFTMTPSPAVAGVPVMFDASASSDPDASAGDAIVRYEWDLDGNGTFEVDGGEPVATTTFATTGSHAVTLRVTDRNGATGTQTQTLDVVFGLINQTLRNALVGTAYQQQLAAGGATGPVTFSVTSGPFAGSGPYAGAAGTPCAGLQLTALGRLAGTPTEVGVCGPFTVTATAGVATAAHTYSVRVLPAVAYVANNGSSTVSVIDPATRSEVAVIPVPGQPGGVAVRPDGERVYATLPGNVSNLSSVFTPGGSNAIAVIDPTVDPPTVTTIPVGSRPTGIVASPDGRLVYVANTASHSVSVIDAGTQTVSETFSAGLFPIGLALSPGGNRLYVARPAQSDIGVFDVGTHAELTQIKFDNYLVVSVAVSPDGRYLFAGSGVNSSVRVIDTTTLSEVPTTGLPNAAARGISITPDGRFVYPAANPLGVIDVNTVALQSNVEIGDAPFGSAVTPDGHYALLTDFTSQVQSIDIATQTVAGAIAVGSRPAGVGVVPWPALHLATTTLPRGLTGLPYNFAVIAAGGRPGYIFTIDPATLPPGLISDTTGRVTGVPAAAGNYQLSVTATDTDVPQQTVTALVMLPISANTPPVAQFTVTPEPTAVDDVVSFDGQSSFDPDGAAGDRIVAFAWDLDNDGVFDDGNEPFAERSFSSAGQYTVRLRVTDRGGLTHVAERIVSVNTFRLEEFLAVPNPVVAGAPVSFNALWFGQNSSAWRYDWDFTGDGTFDVLNQTNVQHAYGAPGTYQVTMRATDEAERSALVTRAITVIVNAPPVAAFTATPSTTLAGLLVQFEASGSSDSDLDAGGGIASYAWTFGDGATGSGSFAEHSYASPGTYPVQLTVTDTSGVSATTTKSVVITEDHAPHAAFTMSPSPGVPGVPVMFDASASSDPDAAVGDAIVRYEWDLDGDGTFEVDGPTAFATRTYAATATYSVRLRVTDRSGATDVRTQTLDVAFGLVNQTLRNALVGFAYQQQLAAGGATGPVAFSVTSGPFTGSGPYNGVPGTACAGLQLTALGRLAGTPTQVGLCGPFTVTATDAMASAAHVYTMRVLPAVAYVANNGSSTVSVIDPATRSAVGVIPVPGQPGGVAVRPDGERVYVTLSGNLDDFRNQKLTNPGSTAAVIDTASQTVVATIPVGHVPTGIAASPDGRLLYVTNTLSQSISVIDTMSNSVARTIVANGLPVRVAVSPDGTRLYVANLFAGITVFDAMNGSERASIDLQNYQADALALSPDGRYLLVGAANNSTVHVFNTATLAEVTSLFASTAVSGIGLTPDGRLAYLAANPIGVVDLDGFVLTASVPTSGTPFEPAVTPDGGRALVTDFASHVQVIDTAGQTESGTIAVGDRPAGIAVVPNPSLHITSRILPAGQPGTPYAFPVVAAGGVPSYGFTTDGTKLPPGLTLGPGGLVSGIPTAAGNYRFFVTATDADLPHQTDTAEVSIRVGTLSTATISLANLSQVYDGTPRSVAVTTNPPNLHVVVTYDGSQVAPTAAGSYAVVAQLDELLYLADPIEGTLVVAKGPQAITLVDPGPLTYGNPDLALSVFSTSGLAVSIAASGDCTASGTLIHLTAAGTCTIAASQAGDANHEPAPTVERSYAVGARAITVTADPKSKFYGDADPPLTYHITSGTLKAGDAFSGSLVRAAGENVGTYAIQQDTLSLGGNYALSYVGANLTINPRAVTVTADAKTKIYGNGDPPLTYAITSGTLKAGDAFSGSLVRAPGENIGTYAIQQGTLSLGGNYALSYIGANLTITTRAVTVTADAKNKVYGNADPPFTFSITSGSLKAGDGFSGNLVRAPGENVGTYAIQQGTLSLGGNYVLSYVGANLTISTRAVTVTADPKNKVYGSADPPLTFSITSGSLKTGDAFSGNLTRMAGENVGSYAIQQGTLSLGSNYALSYVPSTLTIAERATTTVVSGPAAVQYSDPITLAATVSASIYGPSSVIGSVEFFIGGRSYGTSPVAGAAASQTVTKSVVVIEAPGPYTVKAVFTSGNANYSSSQGAYALTVQSENAVPIADLGAYTGQIAAWTPTSTSNTATLTLAATIKDISVNGGDPSPGDITTATVSFALRTSTGALTPISGATNLPVGLVNPGVPGVGTAAKIVQFSLNANSVCDYYTVAVLIGGNYNMPTPTYQDTALTICRATPGSILANPAAGLDAAGTAGFIAGRSTTNFDVKFNKSGTNPQGKAKVILTSPLNAATGSADGKTHTYVITSNSIASLSVVGSKAAFASKANIVELVTNADGTVTAVTIDTAATLQLAMTDNGASGDTLAVTLNKSQGGLWFSSSWNGTQTTERAIQPGDIKVTP